MTQDTEVELARGLRIFIATAIAGALALAGACDTNDAPCDNMCDQLVFGDVEEVSRPDGTLSCTCSNKKPSAGACADYCEEMGGTADDSSVEGKSCVCASIES